MRTNSDPKALEVGDLVETDYYEGSYRRAKGAVYRIVGFEARQSQSGRMVRTVPHAPTDGPSLPELDAAWLVPAGKPQPKRDTAELSHQQVLDLDP
jgi:hypothetical protein